MNMVPWMPLETVPTEAIAALSPEQQSYVDEFKFLKMRNGCGLDSPQRISRTSVRESEYIQGWYAGELLAIWDGKVWDQKLATEIRESDCYYNVYCGDVGDDNVAKWCAPCQRRQVLRSFK